MTIQECIETVSKRLKVRNNPMFVLNNNDEIEYVAAEPMIVKSELDKLFADFEKDCKKINLKTLPKLFLQNIGNC